MKIDTILYVIMGGVAYGSTVPYVNSIMWWCGLASSMLIPWKAKRSPGKGA